MINIYTECDEIITLIQNYTELNVINNLSNLENNSIIYIHINKIGKNFINKLRSELNNVKIVYLVEKDVAHYLFEIVGSEFSSYILTSELETEFKSLLNVVSNNGIYISSYFKKIFVIKYSNNFITNRDIRIIELLVNGYTYNEIAQITYLTVGTVRNYVSNILGIYGFKNKTQLAIHFQKIFEN